MIPAPAAAAKNINVAMGNELQNEKKFI